MCTLSVLQGLGIKEVPFGRNSTIEKRNFMHLKNIPSCLATCCQGVEGNFSATAWLNDFECEKRLIMNVVHLGKTGVYFGSSSNEISIRQLLPGRGLEFSFATKQNPLVTYATSVNAYKRRGKSERSLRQELYSLVLAAKMTSGRLSSLTWTFESGIKLMLGGLLLLYAEWLIVSSLWTTCENHQCHICAM